MSNGTKIRSLAISYFLAVWFCHMADDSKLIAIGIFILIGALSFVADSITAQKP